MIKNIIEFFLKQKSLTHLLFIFLIVMAFFSYKQVPKEMFPPSSLEKIIVSGDYLSTNSEVLDIMIVRDCEEILKNNPNIQNIHTMITKGKYHLNADIKSGSKNLIVNEIQNEILKLDENYPDDMKLPTVKAVSQVFPLISISLYEKNKSDFNIVQVSKKLKDEINSLKHIYQTDLVGKFDDILELKIDYKKLEAFGVSALSVTNLLESSYLISPIGMLKTDTQQYFVNTKSTNIINKDILNSKINIDGKTLFIRDFATLKSRYEKHSLSTRTNAKRSIIINTKKGELGDSLKLSKQINKILQSYKKQYPSIEFKVLSDSSFWIKTRLNTVSSNIIFGLILLFFAIWVFISLKIALVVIIGIPVSFAFGIIGLDIFSHSLNTLSMIGVLLTLGLLVDEAIVVSENIHRHKLLGASTYQACIDGTYEVMPTLFVAMITTIIAFMPLVTISGGLGVFIKIIPMMVIILIVSSFLESFIFLPSHYLMFNKTLGENKQNFRDKIWDSLISLYGKYLKIFIKIKYIFVAILVVSILALSYIMIKSSKFILFPEFDAMSINIIGKVDYNSLEYTSKQIEPLEKILLENLDKNNYSSIHTTIGMKTDGRSLHEKANNFFTITINLKPKVAEDYFNAKINPYFQLFGSNKNEKRTRQLSAREIETDIKKWLKVYENKMELITNIPQTGVVKNDIAISLSNSSNELIQKAIEQIEAKAKTVNGVYNIKNDMNYDDLILEFDLNNYGKSLGFTQKDLTRTLRKYLTIQKITKLTNNDNQLVRFKLTVKDKKNLDQFNSLKIDIPNTNGKSSLLDITNIVYKKQISTIKKEDLQKVFTITASLDKKLSSSRKFYKELEPLFKDLKKEGIKINIKGEAGKNAQVKKDITKSFIFAFFGILLVLTWFFNSLRLSIFSLSVIPLSILGVLIGHKILSLPLTFSTMLGFVGLVGIVMNDTLMMLKFIKDTKNIDELVAKASLRLRPIFLTSITTILGLTTLIFFASGESLLMQPLAVSIGFGLLGATIINLFYIPVAYTFKMKS